MDPMITYIALHEANKLIKPIESSKFRSPRTHTSSDNDPSRINSKELYLSHEPNEKNQSDVRLIFYNGGNTIWESE